MSTGIFILLGLSVVALAGYACYHAGKADRKAEELDEYLSTNHKANAVRDRLRRDPLYARRVRNRFTR